MSPVDLTAGGIFSPVLDIQKNKDFADRTIVPMAMEKRSPHLQYDDKTSEIGKLASKGLKGIGLENQYTSPKAIDHMIDSWSGVVGDFALPLTTNDGKTAGEKALGPLTRRFIADPVYSNQGIEDFYDSYNKIQTGNDDSSFLSDGADKDLPTPGKEAEKQAKEIATQMKEITNQVNEIQKSSLDPKAKKEQITALNIQKAMLAMEYNKNTKVDSIDYSVPYEKIPFQEDIERLAGLGVDNVRPKKYNNATYKVNDKEITLTAEDKVKYTKLAREMYLEKAERIIKSGFTEKDKAKRLAELNKQIDKKIKEMMRRN